MARINPGIFKKYDIRGAAAGEKAALTTDVARAVGQAFATYLQSSDRSGQVVVGRDNRLTSNALQEALMDGLVKSGCEVTDLGMVATPVVYWQAVRQGHIGGVMVTGSHLPADQNGFKLCIGHQTLYGDQIQAIRAIIDGAEFLHAAGGLTTDGSIYDRYIQDLGERIPKSGALRVVIDGGNGMGGMFARRLVELWGHMLVDCLYCEPDGAFPHHHPNPQEPENVRELGHRVRQLNADIGIAFDGDSDRMGVVDEHGHLIAADRVLALLALDLLKRHPGAVVVADVLSSQVLFDAVESAGGRAIMAASGHSLVKEAMREHSALLGGEMSGHIFLGEDYYGFDDGFMAAGRFLQLVASSGKPVSALNAGLPVLYSTPEYRPHCPDEDKQTVISGVGERLAGRGVANTVDGLRIRFERGWGLLRASNTEPVLSLRFEGETEADALQYRSLFAEALRSYPQVQLPF